MTEQPALKPGPYVLDAPVKNPKPDRRQRYDWRAAPEWPKGKELTVFLELHRGSEGQTFKRLAIRETWGRWTFQVLYADEAEYLTRHLVPAVPTPDLTVRELLDKHHAHDDTFAVLVRLLRDGVIDADQIDQALTAINAEYDQEHPNG